MKQIILLFIILSFSLCLKEEFWCGTNSVLGCKLDAFYNFYNYICHCFLSADSLFTDYKIMKSCPSDKETWCYQNNLNSPEYYCLCKNPP